uniref:Uncharacterized protein n=1 Tax=Anguilla anguilla TaxID=7936 RepID=A0A0E9VA34_ANGAN
MVPLTIAYISTVNQAVMR